MRPVRVAIVGGAGGTGAATAFNLVLTGLPLDIAVVDAREAMVTSHLMDLDQVLELSPGCSLARGSEDTVHEADLVVVTAAAPLTVNASRLVYLDDNARIEKHAAAVIAVAVDPAAQRDLLSDVRGS